MIPYTEFGGDGPNLHFMHANGYPPACYLPLFDLLLSNYRVTAMHLRPLWPGSLSKEISNWQPFTDDFLLFLDEQNIKSVIAVGHSMGATISLRASLSHPDRFRGLILIDPVLFPPAYIIVYNFLKAFRLNSNMHPLISAALKRRSQFDNLADLYNSYRRKNIFRYLSESALHAYVAGITKPSPAGGFELVYPPEWEARIYYTGVWRDMDLWRRLSALKVPTLIIRGAESDTFMVHSSQLVKRLSPTTIFATLEKSTHLVPLEKPQETFDTIQDFLKEIL